MRVALVDERRVNLIGEYTHVVLGGRSDNRSISSRVNTLRSGCAGCTARRHGSRSRTPAQWRRNRTAIHHCAAALAAPAHSIGISRTSTPYRRGTLRNGHISRSRYHDGVTGAHDLAQEHFERLQHVRHRADARWIHPSRSGAAMRRTSGRPPSSTGRECSRARHVQ